MLKTSFEISSVVADMLDSNYALRLPDSYQPTEYDIICGRGRGLYRQPGNIRFHAIILNHLEEYSSAKTRLDKSCIVIKIIDTIRAQNNGDVHFIRQVGTNGWEELGDELVRDKVGHSLLSSDYVQHLSSLSSLSLS
jgi:hypothetical protein